ncbi:MAG: T9SS type A sorting domain-containing protein [Bacteroidota bacterium]|nr:T9SS type A sorting domain-containing protein [Bacteroidota bacterium]
MKKITYLLIIFFAFGLNGQNPTLTWAKKLGGVGASAYCYSTKTDQNGNVITVGVFNNTIDFDPGPGTFTMAPIAATWDIFILKLDGNGDLVWAKQIGGISNNDVANEVFTDLSGNCYFTGRFGGTVDFDPGPSILNMTANGDDLFAVKMDANGNLVWAKTLNPSSSDYGQDICVDITGNVFVLGRVSGNVDVDPGPGITIMNFSSAATLLLKLDNAGNFVYGKKIDGAPGSQAMPRAVITDTNGNVFIAGDYFGNVDFDPGPSTSTLVAGGPTYFDGFIEKIDAVGNFAWAASINGNGGPKAIYDIQVDANNDLYAVGFFSTTVDFQSGPGTSSLSSLGSYDAYLLKYSNSGTFKYVKHFGGTGTEVALEIDKDGYNNMFIGGYFAGTADFDPNPPTNFLTASSTNPFIVKVDTASNFLWAVQFGGTGLDVPLSISVDQNSNVYTAGYFNSNPMNFDPGPGTFTMSPTGLYDGFVHKLNGCNAPPNAVDVSQFNSLSICAQNSTTLSATGIGTLNWYSSITSTNSIATGSSFITSTLSVGVYTYYVSANTCTSSPARTAITVSVDVPPILTVNTSSALICAGVTVAISASGANTYSWNNGGTTSLIVVTPVLSTVFIVTGYNGNCTSTGSIVQNVAWCSGVEEFENDVTLSLSPNPNTGLVQINSDLEISSLKVMDIAGKELIIQKDLNSSTLKLDLSKLQNSVYILHLTLSDGRSKTRKLIIQK